MSWHTLHLADVAPQAWKNGGGLTRELLAWPAADNWRIRLSVADITADGPFSVFPGVERWFAVLQGQGVCLSVDGAATELGAGSTPFTFDGAAQTDCKLLGGATRDFNLMLRGANGQLQRVKGHQEGRLKPRSPENASVFIAIYAIDSSTIVRFNNDTCTVSPGSLAWRLVPAGSDSAPYSVQTDNALWMEITA